MQVAPLELERLKILIVDQDFHSHIPGFETFHGNKKLPVVINRHLTKALSMLFSPAPLSSLSCIHG